MANVKVSELTTASTFGDNDYTMIVQNNENRKITKTNLLSTVESEITSVQNEIANLLKTDSITSTSISINAGAEQTFSLTMPTIQGYTPIGVLYIDSQNGIDVMKWSLYLNALYIRVKNETGSAISATVTAKLLYLKNYN